MMAAWAHPESPAHVEARPSRAPRSARAASAADGGRCHEEGDGQGRGSDGGRAAQAVESARKTAEALLKTLGEMKGLPLKLGQMASYIDGLAPPGYEERFKQTLKKLQAKAPPLSPEAAIRVVTEDLGSPPEEIFAEWEREPFAAASIGQVHRAVTRGGDRVAVKVQYPGIDKAIENDLKSISLLESMMAPVGRRYHTKEGLDEIRAVFMGELDYRREAEMAGVFRRIHKDDPDIVVPYVHQSLSTKRVLTCDLVLGEDYATFGANASQADKNAAAQTIWRFMMRALMKHALLYADPHPGNYRFLGGGRVAFLDFGCHKQMPHDLVRGEKRYLTAQMDGDDDAFYRACIEVLGYNPTDSDAFPMYIEYTRLVTRPVVVDETFTYTTEYAREMVGYLVRNTKKIVFKDESKLPHLPKPIHIPRDHLFMNRLQWGLTSVLAGMNATANWHRIVLPWVRGDIEAP